MECSVGGAVITDLCVQERAALLEDVALTSLQGMLTAVPDPRSPHGRRYSLAFLLTCLVAALLCNGNSLEAVGHWCRNQQPLLRAVFGPRRHLTPTWALYRWLLPQLDVERLEGVLATLHAPADEALVADGETVRGAATAHHAAPHLLSVSTAHSQETVLQVRVDGKTNDIPVLQAIAPHLPVAGRGVHATAPVPDGALQSTSGPLVAATAGLNFAGVGNGDYGFAPNAAPPDTNGAVGAT